MSLSQANAFSIDRKTHLVAFNLAKPHHIIGRFFINGLQVGESILGIDFRPATGQLYALGSTSRIYVLDIANIVGNQVSAILQGQLSVPISGEKFGFDFNPTVDRIRIVSNNGQNLRVNPANYVVIVDTPIAAPNRVVGSTYTNSVTGATSTTLYDVTANNNKLVIQAPPNDGVITPVGSLGIKLKGGVGFDIQSLTNKAYLLSNDHLYDVDLRFGFVCKIGRVGCGLHLNGLATRLTPSPA